MVDDDRPTHVSLFAGVDGVGLGFERAGFRTIASVEIDPFCNRVRAKREPCVPQFGDIRDFGGVQLAERRGRSSGIQRGSDGRAPQVSGAGGHHGIDILSGGFPCQDVSVAGKRAGLAGARSGLFFEFVRVARELRPTWLLVENVPGLLSSNGGRDFAVVLATLGDAGYFVEWRVLDSRWFGVAQRRRRVFLVGHLGGPPARPVLFESESGGGDSASRDEAGEDVAYALAASVRGTGDQHGNAWNSTYIPEARATRKANTGRNHIENDYIPEVGRTLRGTSVFRKSRRAADPNDDETWVPAEEANTLNAFDVSDVRTTQVIVEVKPTLLTMREGKNGGGKGPLISGERERLILTGNGQTLFASSVRRLTPTECERLQGFPDGWTCLCDADPCSCPDGPRYAALGNAVTVPVAEWIGRRILNVAG